MLTILCLAVSVNLRAVTLSPWGAFKSLLSLVTVPTTATIGASFLPLRFLAILESERGYLLSLDWLSLRRMTLLNELSVLLARKEYS